MSINFEELRKLIDQNPSLLTNLQQNQPVKPAVQENPVKPKNIRKGMIIEVEEPAKEELIKITPKQAKKLQQEIVGVEKRTRNITPEQKEILLANLAKGREKLKIINEEKKKLKEGQQFIPKKPEPQVLKFQARQLEENPTQKVVVKKYIVQEKEKKERLPTSKKTRKPIESDEGDTDEDTDHLVNNIIHPDTSDTDTSDGRIIRKIKKKVASIKKAEKIIKDKKASIPTPPINPYNPFF
jgi:hypothetical protein